MSKNNYGTACSNYVQYVSLAKLLCCVITAASWLSWINMYL